MEMRVNITTFRQWLVQANKKAEIIDQAGDKIMNMLRDYLPAEGVDVWTEIGVVWCITCWLVLVVSVRYIYILLYYWRYY